ncbi:hypothetical protein FHX42_004800 [Saccharopolyspora lacisalsi]|uniref:Uncharacterized protein n=1 Tax=Halosaccharopolyspora lacisalsi TaxID=1000566 RepID=A0A839E0V8_9PSEU|nr:IniB N-terminal domain-containing protein [Halosaccharopolyspora lacisalsi]MBA8827404.1 hypothetical protein [Halosaccharopolyspora lacisalsi]
MPHTQQDQAPGQVGNPNLASEAPTASGGQPDAPTLHEFLTRLVGDSHARSAFEASPQASLQDAGLGDMNATDVLQGASLVLDYAPVEVVQEYGRSLQSSVETFAASTQHVAINHLDPSQDYGWEPEPEPPREPAPEPPPKPAPEHEQQEATEPMLHNSGSNNDFSAEGDADAQMPEQSAPAGDTNVDINQEQTDSQNLVNVHDVLSGNEVANGNAVGAVGNTVDDTVGGVGNVVDGVGGTAEGAAASGLGAVNNTVDTVGDTADTATGLVGDTADTATDLVGGAPNAVGSLAGDVTGDAAHLAGGATSGLPLDGVL